ncbi:MAG: DUF3575 domain-containing protein [Lutibacter sp.]|nr:DUF3575 domain-containing protein [Lutibacter sp.]MBP9599917.1 DUF3575 domain-containing protein [Lutibacter sp.]
MNLSNLIGFKWLDIGYERILNEESSIGVGTLISLDNNKEVLNDTRTFSLTPYYRHFLSDKYAQGLFVEAFSMIHSGKFDSYTYTEDPVTEIKNEEKFTDLAVGVSVGAKWATPRGFVAEAYVGIGRDMLNKSNLDIVKRGGISIGYRFQ